MEIVEDRDDYCEEEEEDEEKQMLMSGGENMGKHQTFPFYPSSSSPSPPSSSSSHYKGAAAPQRNGRWGGSSQINYDKHQRLWNLGSTGGFEYSRAVDEGGGKSTSGAAAASMGFAHNYSAQFDAMDTTTGSSQLSHGRGDPGDVEEGVVLGSISTGAAGGEGGSGLRGTTAGMVVEKEHMFDKVVTPSDVGKLNRLVIPKQHAEKYFPLDSSANEKGLLLSFEDRSGKPWRFRYSYWNSSQSYVMTKGWSRFVKEKKLDAGDIVSFERGVGDLGKDRLYIDWKRRPDTGVGPDSASFRGLPLHGHYPAMSSLHRSLPWGRIFFPPATVSHHLPMPPVPQTAHMQQQQQQQHHHLNYAAGYNVVNPGGSVFYLRSAGPAVLQQHGGGGMGVTAAAAAAAVAVAAGGIAAGTAGGGDDMTSSPLVPMVFDSVPVVHGKAAAAAKRLRLFGVNLDCPTGEEGDNDILSSAHTLAHAHAHPMASYLPHPDHEAPPQPQPSPPLQLRLCGGGPLPTSAQDLPRKTRPSLSFDLDI